MPPRRSGVYATLEFHALTADRWPDLERLFGPRGACGGCWCMWFRLRRSQFIKQKGPSNKRAFKKIVCAGEVPGLLAYVGDEPIGWCAVAPREEFEVLGRSRVLKPVDDRPVWSAVCFFVAKGFRRQGVTTELLKAAAKHARKNGATILEGYPVEARKGVMPDAFAYSGLPGAFRKAGFVEVARRSATRPIMRLELNKRGLQTSRSLIR
jgi:GNAT superfamily N-acetyltransferase